jgi:hypothetical protein
MKKIKTASNEYYPNLIYFEFSFYQDEYIFLENRNFKTETIKTALQRYYLDLTNILNLKQFKIEISE